MNDRRYRLVFNQWRGMRVAVEVTVRGAGNAGQSEAAAVSSASGFARGSASDSASRSAADAAARGAAVMSGFARPHTAMLLLGAMPALMPMISEAQVVAAGAHAPTVIPTANGIPQVNISAPSGAGVSQNTYSQFDVPKSGVVLNNSPTIVNTQQAGYINGNPNLAPGQSARIILNQVNSSSPTQLRGYLEVAGSKAEVVVANGSGIVVDGGGFINTTRGILTTGSPLIGANGAVTGFDVHDGQITVQGAGLNAANVEQVDLIARAVRANAALYANQLNVVTGANHVDHEALATTPLADLADLTGLADLAGTGAAPGGAAPGVSIDVAQLGGMYANRIWLVGTEKGVGVSLAGIAAAQAGDLTLTTEGKLVLTGKTQASGNLMLSAHDGIDNSGTTYAQQAVSVSTAGDLTNRGTLAAQQNTTVNANNVASMGTLGAGIHSDGSIAPITQGGDLTVIARGTLSATGHNAAAGHATLSGAALNLAGSQTSANGHLALTARGGHLSGELNLANATTTAGGALSAHASGDLINRNGAIRQYGQADQTLSADGVLDNTGGTVASHAANLTVSAQTLFNHSGSIQHAGTGTLNVTAARAASSVGGQVATHGALTLQAASLDNTNGKLTAQGAARINAASGIVNRSGTLYGHDGLTVFTQGALDNTLGSAQTVGTLSVTAGETLTNTQGTLYANGAHGKLDVSAGRLDNTSGKLTNAGNRATTVSSATGIVNTGGTLGGNGDVTVNAQDLVNTEGAQLIGAGATKLNIARRVNNAGGTIFGGTALMLNSSGAIVTNEGGAIAGGQDVSLQVASLSNPGGTIRANRDITASGAMTGAGEMTAGRNLALNVAGDYTNDAANRLHADGDMSVSATGTLTNTGTLAATGALRASGANVINAAGADIHSFSTTLNAAGTLTNAGRLEGETVTTTSATLANTGTVIGNALQVNATDVQNTGVAAVMAGAQSVKIHASNSVSNTDGALIYSAGDLEIAKDGTREPAGTASDPASDPAPGLLANQTGTLTNRAASIEAEGDIDIAAHTVENIRTGVLTQAGTPQVSSKTLTIWTAGIPIGDLLNSHRSDTFSQWNWTKDRAPLKAEIVGRLATPIRVTVPKSQVTNLDTTAQTFSLTQPLTEHYKDRSQTKEVCHVRGACTRRPVAQTRPIATNPTQWYERLTEHGDTYTFTFWPDFDPNRHIRPDQVKTRFDLGPDSHDYSEISRTVHTTATSDALVSAGRAARIQAQGAIRLQADGGRIDNQSSVMAAGGDLVRRASGGSVSDSGTVLQQTLTQHAQSSFYWHQKRGGSTDTQRVDTGITQSSTTVDALPAIAASNQDVQTHAQHITVRSVDRQGQTVAGSGVTGVADVTDVTGITDVPGIADGRADGAQSGAISGPLTRPQTIGTATGGLPNLTLPVNGLYTYHPAPDATYLIATDPRFTQAGRFLSSDYLLGQLGLDPQKTVKRLGDGLYEQRLIRDQVTHLTGRPFLAGYTDPFAQYTALMNRGVAYAKTFDLEPGLALTPAQMRQLTTDMVWLVAQDVTLPDGSHQTVLVPQVYLAQSNSVELTRSGALVAGGRVNLNASGEVDNSGHVLSDLATTVVGHTITNSGILDSAGSTIVAAGEDVRNTSGRTGGDEVRVQAGRDVIHETRTEGVSKSFGSNTLTGRVTGTGVHAIGTISATNRATVLAGRDVSLSAATIQAGGHATIGAGRDLNIETTTLTSTQDVQTRDGLNGGHDRLTQNLGSALLAGGDLTTRSGRDTTLTGATVSAGGHATLVAGQDLTVTAAKDRHTHDARSMGGELSHHTRSSDDETVQGARVEAGGNVTLAAGQSATGKLTILGSTVATDSGAVELVSSGDVTLGRVAQTHDAQGWSEHHHAGFLSRAKTTDTTRSHQVSAIGSTVSGESVTGAAAHDLTISGSTVAATQDVRLAAAHTLRLAPSQDTRASSHFHQELKTGLGSAGGVGISYGRVDQQGTTHDSALTQNGSLVGSTDGSVHLSAGRDLHVTGSDLIAAKDVSGTGANVTIDAATDTMHHDETHEVKQRGFTLALKAPVLDGLSNTVGQAHAASRSQDSRAAALHGMAAASGAVDVVGTGGAAAGALANGHPPEAKLELSYGSSHNTSTFAQDSTTSKGSSVTAGGTAAFVATGGGASSNSMGNTGNGGDTSVGSGDVTIAGSNVNANDIVLSARNQVSLHNTTDTDSTRSTNASSSASVGVSYGTQGLGVSASGSKAHGDDSSDAAMQNNTHVKGANSVQIVSGGDTNLIGAHVSGRQVTADIGGNLTIASVQDTATSRADQESSGGSFSISQGGGSASFSRTSGNANGRYAGVNVQAGIHAGSGGFDITVQGNTDLKGGDHRERGGCGEEHAFDGNAVLLRYGKQFELQREKWWLERGGVGR
ncbi:hemagglutinin repeat-containing protein [Pararobbsia alpina]|uniref:Filamentous haemagglutinin FhaB/tRNA nuclease CdiA-like TPS domain-containing protein n=1 Tax=Pararobbsia alpina TaxID=621374 RepID=A0A6S7BF22_9BURK|nr:hemagglutinin repeat-containing protein [Pararobbsia alpina]CAB3798306.1 hypothetical protein LMG28138_04415 [Pararobbsia alpina]